MISVVIPTWNCPEYLRKSLKSFAAQELAPDQIIVVDDGSDEPERNLELAKSFGALYVYQEHQNANVARNRGQRLATGEYILFADSDCEYSSGYLQRLYSALRGNDAPFAYCDFQMSGEFFNKASISGTWSRKRLERGNFIDTSSLIRMSAWKPFDESLRRLQDWDLWLTITKDSVAPVYVGEVLYHNVVRPNSVTVTEDYTLAKEYVINKHSL